MNPPKPFCQDIDKIKAFVLGCDPTAFDKHKNRLSFEFVFDLNKGERYFRGVIANLNHIGLRLEGIYVQNLITDYQDFETSKNKAWKQTALNYISSRKREFDKLDSSGTIPVFLTSEIIYKVLLNADQKIHKANDLYTNEHLVPIFSENNKLERPLIPLYRHWSYNLDKHPEYLARIHF